MNDTKSKRFRRIYEYDYGDLLETNIRKPLMAIIEYDESDEFIIYSDFSKLDVFLEKEFIPNYINIIKNAEDYEMDINSKTIMGYIPLHCILIYNFCDLEIEYIFNYLKKKNIVVRGTLGSFSGEFSNYDHICNHPHPKAVNNQNINSQEILIMKYKETHDIELKKQLILNNLKLVEYVLNSINYSKDISIDELLSYGYEGLIMAIEKYNPTYGVKFSSFAYKYINGYILDNICHYYNYVQSFTFNFLKAKKIIESEYCEKLENNLDLLDVILNYMQENNQLGKRSYRDYKRMVLLYYKDNIDEYNEDENMVYEEEFFNNISFENIKNQLDKIFEKLDVREKEILKLYFGFDDNNPIKGDHLAQIFNISRTRLYTLIRNILIKIKNLPEYNDLFLEYKGRSK